MPYKDPAKQKEYFANYKASRKEHYVELSRAWRENNRERWDQNQRNYRENNRELIRTKQRKRYLHNPEHVLGINRESYSRHREKRLAEHRAYQKKHRQRIQAQNRARYLKNREMVILRNSDYAKRNPNIGVLRAARRRTRLVALPEDLKAIAAFMRRSKLRKRLTCYYCKKRFPGHLVHFDHVIALSNGGTHTLENISTACPHCNLTKSAKPMCEVTANGQSFLTL